MSEGEKFSVYYQLLLLVTMVMARGAAFPGHTHTHTSCSHLTIKSIFGDLTTNGWMALNPAVSTPEAFRRAIRMWLFIFRATHVARSAARAQIHNECKCSQKLSQLLGED